MRACLTAALLWLHAAGAAAAEWPAPDWGAVSNEAAQLLAAYVRIDTQNPPGRTVEAADFLDGLLRRAGLTTERVAANAEKPFVIGRLAGSAGGGKPIVLLNHMDVVPADPKQWSFPPLSGEIRDGVLYGRGAIDMKGFGIVQLLALQLLAARGERPRHDIIFLAVPDEEVGGGEGMQWLAQHRPDVMDADAVWDEGGFGVTATFPKPVFFTAVTEKKVLWLRLIAEGRAGHGSRPFPDSAPLRLHQALEHILSRPVTPRLTAVTAETFARTGAVVPGMRGFVLRNLDSRLVWLATRSRIGNDPLASPLLRDTIALTMLAAGYKPNVIPESATAVLDCRLLPDTDRDVFLSGLKRTIDDPAIRIEIIQESLPTAVSPTDHPLFAAIEASVTTAYPGAIMTPYMAVGGTDSRYFRQRGVAAYGLIPVLVSEALTQTMHGIDERLPTATLGPAVRVVYDALRRL